MNRISPTRTGRAPTRREFLSVGGAGALALTGARRAPAAPDPTGVGRCIQLVLTGGPSHLDTFDPKPDAPSEIRGPFAAGRTDVAGLHLCAEFHRLRRRARRFSLIRSLHHGEVPIHETGLQLVQTGRVAGADRAAPPHLGAMASALAPARAGLPGWVVLPRRLGDTGTAAPQGQDAGHLGPAAAPLVLDADPADAGFRGPLSGAGPLSAAAAAAFDLSAEPDAVRDRYGRNTFGQSCLLARRLVERGVRFVTVNMADTVFDRLSWDCHADGGALNVTLDDYRRFLIPWLDGALSALLDDLWDRGLSADTVVVAAGEFGRTPRPNSREGRDHWPHCWSALVAGGRFAGGRTAGASDRIGAYPADRPVTPAELAASVLSAMGIDPAAADIPGPDGGMLPAADAAPVAELF
jgi:uncharacterized protein (DUF1501 family)